MPRRHSSSRPPDERAVVDAGRLGEDAGRELAPDRRRDAGQLGGGRGEAGEPRGDHRLHARRPGRCRPAPPRPGTAGCPRTRRQPLGLGPSSGAPRSCSASCRLSTRVEPRERDLRAAPERLQPGRELDHRMAGIELLAARGRRHQQRRRRRAAGSAGTAASARRSTAGRRRPAAAARRCRAARARRRRTAACAARPRSGRGEAGSGGACGGAARRARQRGGAAASVGGGCAAASRAVREAGAVASSGSSRASSAAWAGSRRRRRGASASERSHATTGP